MSQAQAGLIPFLSEPASYPHDPDEVNHIQTHISHVFLAPPYVYKIKKPVNFDFLDFSSLDKRKHYCRREVALNRRLCSEIYLGVVPIARTKKGFALLENRADPVVPRDAGNGGKETREGRNSPQPPEPAEEGEIVEYAVRMKKLSEEYFLHSYIERGELKREQMDRVADRLADFYLEQEPGDAILKWGAADKIKYNTDENFRQTERFIGETVDRPCWEGVKWYTDRYLSERKGLFRRRVKEKRIVDGHGDLHLEHIHLGPRGICIYDCIEFNDRFRYGDLAADLAFLAMDLDFNGKRDLGRHLVRGMADRLEDPDLPRIINFYKCYRAWVKGKVKSLQSAEEEVPGEERERASQLAGRYFRLGLEYALLGSTPTALVVMGTVGSGKSTLSAGLASALSLDRFSSDRLRKEMAGQPLRDRTPAAMRDELYSDEVSDRTYDALRERALERIGQGESVVLDATYSNAERRNRLARALEESGADYCFIECRAPESVLRKRLKKREENEKVISDARLEDFEYLSGIYTPPDEIEDHRLVRLNTNRPVPESLTDAHRALAEKQISGES